MFQIKSTYPGVIAALILLNSVACEMFINPIDIRTAILKEDKLVKIFKSLPVRKGTPAEHHIQA